MFNSYSRVSDLPAQWPDAPNAEQAAQQGFQQLSFQRGFLRAVELHQRNPSTRLYFLRQAEEGAMAAAQGMVLDANAPSNPLLDVALGRFARPLAVSRRLLPKTLLLQAPLSNDSPLDCTGPSPAARAQVLGALLTDVLEYAQSRGMMLALTGVQDAHQGLIDLLRARQFACTPAGATTELELDCTTWNGYLQYAGKFSRNARSAIRREVNLAERTGLEIRRWSPGHESGHESGQQSAASLHQLLEQHWQRYNGEPFPYTSGVLAQLQQGLGDRLHLLVASRDGAALGLSTFFAMGSCGYQPFVGVGEEQAAAGSPYFHLMFYEPIRRAMLLGIKRLYPGSTTYAAKVRRGCQVRPTWLFVAVRRQPARWLTAPLFALHAAAMRRKQGPLIRAERFATLR